MPDNYDLSLKRLQALKIRLVRDEMLLQKYDQIFQDQINDASAKLKNEVSLKDILYTGPCLNPELYKLLQQF